MMEWLLPEGMDKIRSAFLKIIEDVTDEEKSGPSA